MLIENYCNELKLLLVLRTNLLVTCFVLGSAMTLSLRLFGYNSINLFIGYSI